MYIIYENTGPKYIQIQRGEKEIATINFNRDFIEKTTTVAIIRKNNKILINRRKKYCRLAPNKWEFPRGKVEPNEIYEEYVIRKVKKEFGITISIDKLFLTTIHIYVENNRIIKTNLLIYLTDWVDGEVKNIGCNGSLWVDSEELVFYDFVEADFPIIKDFLTLINKGYRKYEVQ